MPSSEPGAGAGPDSGGEGSDRLPPVDLVLVGPYPPYRGGIAHFTSSLHDRLIADGRAVYGISFSRQYPSLLFPGTSQREPRRGGGPDAERERDVDELVDTVSPVSWSRAVDAAITRGADEVVFMYWMPFFTPAYARMASLLGRAGIRVTALVHNAAPHERIPFGRTLARLFFKRCSRLVALSDAVASELRAMDAGPPIEVTSHPIYDRFGPGLARETARESLALSEDLELMLFFGLVRQYKGLDLLIDAVGELAARRSRLHLIVAGEFYEDRRAADERLTELGIRDRVTLLDRYIPDEDVPLYFSAADVVVQPYRSATQSGVVQTAFQFGRPVIVTDVGALGHSVRHEVDGLVVPPTDVGALAGAIDRFFGEEDLAARLTRGASTDQDRMTWTEFTAQLFD